MADEKEIKEVLRRLGMGTSSCGYSYIAYGMTLALRDESCMEHITKELYVDIAHRFGTSVGCVERDIRTAVETVWRTEDRELLTELCGGTPAAKRPTNKEFFRMLYGYFTKLPDGSWDGIMKPPVGFWCSRNGRECPQLKTLQDEIGRLMEENRRLKEEAEQHGMPQ